MLDLQDAVARTERARKQSEEVANAFQEWAKSGGSPVVGERDPRFARYGWFVVMNADPSETLALLASEIFNNLRSALDYIAEHSAVTRCEAVKMRAARSKWDCLNNGGSDLGLTRRA